MPLIVSKEYFAHQIQQSDTLLVGGFGCCGAPDELLVAIRNRHNELSESLALKLISVSGVGDKLGLGLDLLAEKGLVSFAMSGFWGFTPKLSKLALHGDIEAHNWPLGVVRQWIRSLASGEDGYFSNIGLGTFVDPNFDGGRLNTNTGPILNVVTQNNLQKIHFPKIGIDWALLRGSSADVNGNISFENEVVAGSSISDAIACKRFKGQVVVQVERLVDKIEPHEVKIPGILVDYLVVSEQESHHAPCYGDVHTTIKKIPSSTEILKEEVAEKVAKAIPTNIKYINFGIGIPALIPKYLEIDNPVTVESGVIGGTPFNGMSFGASYEPQSILEPSTIFDIYHGIGIDLAILGFAEIDKDCCVNVSKFDGTLKGCGGFIDIASSSRSIILCGLSTTSDGKEKFVDKVEHITLDLAHPQFFDKEILIITEKGVSRIENGSLIHEQSVYSYTQVRDQNEF